MNGRLSAHRWTIVEAALLASIALAVRLAHLESATPWYDDFYHLLAARSWLVDGTFSIAEGEYTRAAMFTRLVAESLRLFGDSLAAGRVPAVIAGTLWVVAAFAWTRHVAGRIAGWTAGLLLALDPGAVNLSQWVRFYTLHGLLVWVGAVCVYHLVSERLGRTRATILALAAVASFAAAQNLQESTLLALGGAGLWAGGVLALALPGWVASGRRARQRLWLVAGTGVAVSAVAVWFFASGLAAEYWGSYTARFFWMEGSNDSSRWYAWWLALRYPTLWVLFPVAAALAVARFPRPALFALVMFVTAFVTVSFGPAKQERYLYFAMPFFFGLWGMAVATLLPALRTVGERAMASMGDLGLGAERRRLAAHAFVFVTVAFAASQNDAPRMTLRMVFPGSGERPYREADWASVLPELRAVTEPADVVLSSYVLKSLYYFDRGDFHLSWTETAEAGFVDGTPVEFARDYRTGLPSISTPESIEAIMACYQTGLVLTERFHLNRAHLVPELTTAFLESEMEQVPLPPDSWVIAYRWRHELPTDTPDCSRWQDSSATTQAHDLAAAR